MDGAADGMAAPRATHHAAGRRTRCRRIAHAAACAAAAPFAQPDRAPRRHAPACAGRGAGLLGRDRRGLAVRRPGPGHAPVLRQRTAAPPAGAPAAGHARDARPGLAVPAAVRTRRRHLAGVAGRRHAAAPGAAAGAAAGGAPLGAAGRHHHPGECGARCGLCIGTAPAHGPQAAADRALRPDHGRRGHLAPGRAGGPQRRRLARRGLPARAARRLPARRQQRDAAPGNLWRVGQHRVRPGPAAQPHAAHRDAGGLRAGTRPGGRGPPPDARTGARAGPRARRARAVCQPLLAAGAPGG